MALTTRRLPKINVIQAFKVAAELGSLARAAAQLSLTPAAISQQIRQLEEQLKTVLFVRTQSGVLLTDAGKDYLRYVTEAFDILYLGQQNLQHASRRSRLTLYSLPALASRWLLPGLNDWRERCPDIELCLNGTHASVDFASTSADFVICFGEEQYAQFEKQFLFQDEVVPVASPALCQRYAGKNLLTEAPLIHLDWGRDGQYLPGWSEWFRTRGFDCSGLTSAFTFNLTSLAIDMAIAGGGVVLGQKRLIEKEIRSGELVIVDGCSLPLSKPYFVAWPQRSVNHPGKAALLAWLEGLAESELLSENA